MDEHKDQSDVLLTEKRAINSLAKCKRIVTYLVGYFDVKLQTLEV